MEGHLWPPVQGAALRGRRTECSVLDAFLAAKQSAIRTHRSQFGGLITDDPTGFRLPPDLLSVFDNPYETFLQP